MSKEIIPFYNGTEIRKDNEGRISLTDLWKAAGSKREQAPNFWVNQDSTKQLIDAASGFLNATPDCIIKSKKGKGGGTYAHKQIALTYSKYLSPELALTVNQVFFERIEEEKNPQLAIDRAIKSWKKKGKDDEWISKRIEASAIRLTFTKTLAAHGVTQAGFGACTNGIYTFLFGGGAEKVREKKNLPEKANTREHMSKLELAAVGFAEELAAENIKAKSIYGNKPCEAECKTSSKIVRDAIIASRKNNPPLSQAA